MEQWSIFDGNSGIVVYDLHKNLVFSNEFCCNMRGIKKSMFGKSIDFVYGEFHELEHILNLMKRKTEFKGEYSYTDIRGIKHEVKSDFHAFYYNKKRFIVEREEIHAYRKMVQFHAETSKEKKKQFYDFDDIVTVSKNMLKLKKRAYEASESPSNILIYGETGTGKELLVQSIHRNSKRSSAPFIAQNCAAVPVGLFESIFFGTERGSYTGAENKPGLFELANNGTLYLDELNSMPIELQGKILRTIQEKKVRRVGGSKEIDVNVRIIASINEEPGEVLREKKIRSDLFFRLNVIFLEIPSLKDRTGDIPALIRMYINRFNPKFQCNITGVSDECLEVLMKHSWPGNIRELRNLVEGVFNLKKEGMIGVEDVKERIKSSSGEISKGFKEKVKAYEERLINEALTINNNNISNAAKYLGIPRQTLQSKMNKFKE